MASRALQDWQSYISDYEQKLAAEKQTLDYILADPSKTDAEKKKALDDYTRNKMFLQELKDKYNQYSLEGEVPDEVTFGGGEPTSVIVYKTNIPGDEANIHYGSVGTIGGSGDLSTPNSEIPLGTIFQSDLININVKVYESQGYTQSAYRDVTIGQQYTVDSGGTMYWHIKSNKNLPYGMVNRFNLSGIPGTTIYDDAWSNSNDRIVIEATWGSITNIRTINQNTAYTISTFLLTLLSMLTNPEGTVDGDSPWDYYDKIKPSVNPENDLFPNGYEPPGPGNDPDDDPEEETAPDKQDWGDKQKPNNGFDIPDAFVKYAAFNSSGINNLSDVLWDAPDNFWEALTMTNRNNANWLDYFVSLRAYPYKINPSGEPTNTLYVGAGGELNLGDQVLNRASKVPTVIWHSFTIKVPKYYNNFLDFAPYTKAEIYLPFSGTWEVNPKLLYHSDIYNMQEQAVDNYIYIQLKMDITDGSGVWQVLRSYNKPSGEAQYIILEKQCKIGVEVPLSGLNATTMSSNIVNATLGIGQATLSSMSSLGGAVAAGSVAGPVGAAVGTTMAIANSGVQMLNAATNYANANREIPSYTGGMSGLAAANCNVIPSITFVRPIVENPETFPHTVGNLVNKASKLEKLDGYTTCRNVDISNVPQATDKEKAELKRILEGGFYA